MSLRCVKKKINIFTICSNVFVQNVFFTAGRMFGTTGLRFYVVSDKHDGEELTIYLDAGIQ